MHNLQTLSEHLQVGFTEPISSERLITLKTAEGQHVMLSSKEAEKFYYWLHEYRPTFLSFYSKGRTLAENHWKEAGRPNTYPSNLDLFNAHAAEIPVDLYIDGTTPNDSPTDQAVKGFFSGIRYIEELEEAEEL